MNALAQNPVMQAYVASAIVLALNLLAVANGTALSRAKHKEAINPEDKKLNAKVDVVYDAGNDMTARYRRAHRNALENIPLFLVTGFLLTLTAIPVTWAATLFGVFALMRVIHSICYINSIQPWRTVSFVVASLAQVGVLGYLAYAIM